LPKTGEGVDVSSHESSEHVSDALALRWFREQRRRQVPRVAGLAALVAWSGCISDASNKCGPHMHFSKAAHVCLCDASSVPVAGGCKPCADDRQPQDSECVCRKGTREGADGSCEPVGGLGVACDGEHVCEDPIYSHCALSEGAKAGTCAQPCAADADCDAGYTCADWLAQPYCRQFTAAGAACVEPGPDDPACNGDADYCFMGQCFVRGCTVTDEHEADDCPSGRKCCDVSALGAPGVSTACVLSTSGLCQ
jgi:hypothetical protein